MKFSEYWMMGHNFEIDVADAGRAIPWNAGTQ